MEDRGLPDRGPPLQRRLRDLRRLDPGDFARIHRSTIVRLDRAREMHPWSHGDRLLVLNDGTGLRMSRRYRDRLEGVFGS